MSSIHRSVIHRTGALVAASALAFTTMAAGPAGAVSSRTTVTHKATPSAQSAQWLAGQLRHGAIHNGQYGFDDYGLTTDVGLALDALGGHSAALKRVRGALETHVNDYTKYQSDVYAGPTAKLLAFARKTGGGGTSFGGVDLRHRLKTMIHGGRLSDRSSTGDYANVLGQSYAVESFGRSYASARVYNFLRVQQCQAGYFRLDFTTDKTATDQSCDGAPAKERKPDTDATAIAVLGLIGSHRQRKDLNVVVGHALDWLVKHQKADGSFGGGTTTEASNSNSTGLAAWALGRGGRCSAALKAATWVSKLQVTGSRSGTPLAGERGAVAYDAAALRAGEKDGITVKTRDQWRRATAQAAPGLRYLSASACRSS